MQDSPVLMNAIPDVGDEAFSDQSESVTSSAAGAAAVRSRFVETWIWSSESIRYSIGPA